MANGFRWSSNGAPVGTVGAVGVWEDPDDDGDPRDAVLLATAPWTVEHKNLDIFETIAVPPTVVTNKFIVGAWLPIEASVVPAAVDCHVYLPGLAWVTVNRPKGTYTGDPIVGSVGIFENSDAGTPCMYLLRAGATGGAPIPYCSAKSGLVCGLPSVRFSGLPDAAAPGGFEIRAAPALGQRVGLVLYSCNGRAAIPFEGGLLCVAPPISRSVVLSSGGTRGQCDGVFDIDWNSFASGGLGGTPDPCISVSGQQVNTQFWGRDSVITGSFLSDGLEFVML